MTKNFPILWKPFLYASVKLNKLLQGKLKEVHTYTHYRQIVEKIEYINSPKWAW